MPSSLASRSPCTSASYSATLLEAAKWICSVYLSLSPLGEVRTIPDPGVVRACVGRRLVGDASLAEQIGEAARCAGVVDALQCVEANAIGRSRLATLAGEEEGSRPEQVSGRRCTWPHGGRQMSGGRCDICQRVAYHCGSQ